MEDNQLIEIYLDGRSLKMGIPGGLRVAHGEGLSGAPVNSLRWAPSAHREDMYYVVDGHDNAIRTTLDEVFALLKKMAPDYEITAVKRT